jgi:osomolarity two-component system, response regulator SKN7
MNAGSKYDLVLMDIIMPNLDGVSACHLIRQFDTTPIIAMTSNIRSDDIAMYFQHGKTARPHLLCGANCRTGMNDVLPKPFTKEGLLAMLEKHLAHLKTRGAALETAAPMVPPAVQPLAHTSARQSLKEEDSPAKSPATTSNWNSPNQIPGVSPVASTGNDEYLGSMQPQPAGPYGVPITVQSGLPYGAPPAMTVRQQGPHRRQISEISGGDDTQHTSKRTQMFPPSMQPQPTPMHPPR